MEFMQAIKTLKPTQLLRFGIAVDPLFEPDNILDPTFKITQSIDNSYVDFIIINKSDIATAKQTLFPQYDAGMALLACDYNTMVHAVRDGKLKINAVCGAVMHNGHVMHISHDERINIDDKKDQQTPLFQMVKAFLKKTN